MPSVIMLVVLPVCAGLQTSNTLACALGHGRRLPVLVRSCTHPVLPVLACALARVVFSSRWVGRWAVVRVSRVVGRDQRTLAPSFDEGPSFVGLEIVVVF